MTDKNLSQEPKKNSQTEINVMGGKETQEIVKDAGKEEESATPRIRIKIKAFDHKVIDQATRTIIETVERSSAKIIGPVPLPTERNLYTVNRSSFVHKDARDQYEMRVHKRLLDIMEPTAKTIDSLTNLNLPAGVDVEIKM